MRHRIMDNDSLGDPIGIQLNYNTTNINCEMLQINTKFTENIQDKAPNA